MKNAILYCRTSSHSQIENGGYERQLKQCMGYAIAHKIEVKETFFDEAISGTKNTDERPELGKAFLFAAENNIEIIIVENASRIARDVITAELINAQARKADIELICASTGTVLNPSSADDPTRVLTSQMLQVLQQWEKNQLVRKLQRGREKKKEETGWAGGNYPFGKKNEQEKETLAAIKKLCRKPVKMAKLSYRKIADILNEQGEYKTRSGKPWTQHNLRRIVIANGYR